MRTFILVLLVGLVSIYNVAGFVGVVAWLLGLAAWGAGCAWGWYCYNTVPNPGQENSDDDVPGDVCDNSDNDGLTDEEEADLSTEPTNPDTDGDTDCDGLAMEDEAEGLYHFTQLPLALACHRPESEKPNVKEEKEALIFVLQLWIYS